VASSIDRVKQSIRERLDELESERDQLMKALEALSGGSTTSVGGRRGRPPGSKSNASRRAAGKRAPRGQRREQVIVALQGGEMGPSAIARQVGVNPTQISGLLRQLASEGVVVKNAGGKWELSGSTPAHEQPAAAPEAQAGNGGEAPAPAEPVQG
jgi:predicted Rossmann fold nucleotide-binding protein DprA/Smf involved in DNA uptake